MLNSAFEEVHKNGNLEPNSRMSHIVLFPFFAFCQNEMCFLRFLFTEIYVIDSSYLTSSMLSLIQSIQTRSYKCKYECYLILSSVVWLLSFGTHPPPATLFATSKAVVWRFLLVSWFPRLAYNSSSLLCEPLNFQMFYRPSLKQDILKISFWFFRWNFKNLVEILRDL